MDLFFLLIPNRILKMFLEGSEKMGKKRFRIKCAPHGLICKQELAMCQGINERRYPSLSRARSLSLFL